MRLQIFHILYSKSGDWLHLEYGLDLMTSFWWVEYSASGGMLIDDKRRRGFLLTPSLGLFIQVSQLPCHENISSSALERPCGEKTGLLSTASGGNWGFLPTVMGEAILKTFFFSFPFKPLDKCSSRWQLDSNVQDTIGQITQVNYSQNPVRLYMFYF